MKRTGHCIHATVLSSYRTVVTVSIPSFNGSHNGRPTKNYKKIEYSRLAALQTF